MHSPELKEETLRVNFVLSAETKRQLIHLSWSQRQSMGATLRQLIRDAWLRQNLGKAS